jgi:phosphoglycolate phosphatase
MRSSGYAVILWDWNGTLLDDGVFGLEIINAMLRRRGLREPDRAEHGRLFDFPVRRYYERLGFDFAAEPFETVSHEFVDAYVAGASSCALREGAEETLAWARERGLRQSVLSASRQDYLERFVGHYGLRDYFDELLGIDSVHAPGKSGRGREWIREAGIDPARVLLIGDTVHDSEVAEAMGIDCWLVEGGHHAAERLTESGRRCLPDLAAVRAAIGETLSGAVCR